MSQRPRLAAKRMNGIAYLYASELGAVRCCGRTRLLRDKVLSRIAFHSIALDSTDAAAIYRREDGGRGRGPLYSLCKVASEVCSGQEGTPRAYNASSANVRTQR